LHERNAGQSKRQLGGEFVPGKITLKPVALFAARLEHQGSWRPHSIEAMKGRAILFDVDFDGNKSLLDYSGQLRV